VQQLQTDSSMLGDHRHIATVLSHQQNEHGAHTLATTLTNVLQGRAQQTIIMSERLVEKFDEIEQIMLNGLFDKLKIIHYIINL
jgi:hypothetical protein